MFDPAQLAALAAVHRRGAFDLAAADLGVTPSAISQRIRALEETMGTLLIRRGHPCTATAPGLRLVRHHEEITLLHRALANDLALPHPPAVTRIAINADSLATWAIPALAAVEGLLFDIVIDDQDHSHGLLKSGEVVAALTSQPGPIQGCDRLALGHLRYRALAAPAFLARWLSPLTPQTLSAAPALRFNDKDQLQDLWSARHVAPLALPSHRLASSEGFLIAAKAGLGWGMLPDLQSETARKAGALCELIPHTPLDVPLFWQFNRLTAKALAPLTRALVAAAAALA